MLNFLQGRFMRHPLHPLMVHLPVGLWVGSFICDILYLSTGNANYAVSAYYTMVFGLIAVLLAAPTGFADYLSIPDGTRPKQIATTHMVLNVSIAVLYLINVIVRGRMEPGAPSLVTGGQFFLSIVCIGTLGVSGYLGGLLVYNYGIGHRRPTEVDQFTKKAA